MMIGKISILKKRKLTNQTIKRDPHNFIDTNLMSMSSVDFFFIDNGTELSLIRKEILKELVYRK